jgi:hypothetical protein
MQTDTPSATLSATLSAAPPAMTEEEEIAREREKRCVIIQNLRQRYKKAESMPPCMVNTLPNDYYDCVPFDEGESGRMFIREMTHPQHKILRHANLLVSMLTDATTLDVPPPHVYTGDGLVSYDEESLSKTLVLPLSKAVWRLLPPAAACCRLPDFTLRWIGTRRQDPQPFLHLWRLKRSRVHPQHVQENQRTAGVRTNQRSKRRVRAVL